MAIIPFSFLVIGAFFTFGQFVVAFAMVWYPRRPKRFAILIMLATASMTAYYSLWAWAWVNDNQYRTEYLPLIVYTLVESLPRAAIILLSAAVLIMIIPQRRSFLVDPDHGDVVHTLGRPSQLVHAHGVSTSSQRPTIDRIGLFFLFGMALAPFILFGLMCISAIVCFGLSLGGLHSHKASQVMSDFFLIICFLFTILLLIICIFLWWKATCLPSVSRYRRTVLTHLGRDIMPLVNGIAMADLIFHFNSTPSIYEAVSSDDGAVIAQCCAQGLFYFVVFLMALAIGSLEQPQEPELREKVNV